MLMLETALMWPCFSKDSKSLLLTRVSSRMIAFALEIIGSSLLISNVFPKVKGEDPCMLAAVEILMSFTKAVELPRVTTAVALAFLIFSAYTVRSFVALRSTEWAIETVSNWCVLIIDDAFRNANGVGAFALE